MIRIEQKTALRTSKFLLACGAGAAAMSCAASGNQAPTPTHTTSAASPSPNTTPSLSADQQREACNGVGWIDMGSPVAGRPGVFAFTMQGLDPDTVRREPTRPIPQAVTVEVQGPAAGTFGSPNIIPQFEAAVGKSTLHNETVYTADGSRTVCPDTLIQVDKDGASTILKFN